MNEYENGYYLASFKGMKPIILEKDDFGWNAFGVETDVSISEYEVLRKVDDFIFDINN